MLKKLSLLNDFDETQIHENLARCPKHFCHGDYHGANLIFSDQESNKNQVIGIVDWEYFGYDYRIWEVARSMAFICDIDYNGSMVGPIDFDKALLYLQTYNLLLGFVVD